MKLLFIVLLLALESWAYDGSAKTCGCPTCTPCEPQCNTNASFHWEIYYGKVPNDAFGVEDLLFYRPNTFIGLGHVEDEGVFPGTLRRGSPLLKVRSVTKVSTLCENVMILCSKSKYNLHWMKVHNIDDVELMIQSSTLKLVTGGFNKVRKLFIGRIYHEGIMKVGAVYTDGVCIVNENDSIVCSKEFEILIYYV